MELQRDFMKIVYVIFFGVACVESLHPVSRHVGVWTAPPKATPSDYTIDGPIIGAGGLGAAFGGGGPQNPATVYFGHNAFMSSNTEELLWNNVYTMLSLGVLEITTISAPNQPPENNVHDTDAASSMQPCDTAGKNPLQQWLFLNLFKNDSQSGSLIATEIAWNRTCLDVDDAKTAVVYDFCNLNDPTPNQNWQLMPNTSQLFSDLSGTRFARWPRECAQVGPKGTVSLNACTHPTTPNQTWVYENRQLKVNGLCLTARANAPPPPTPNGTYTASQTLETATVNIQTQGLNITSWMFSDNTSTSIAVINIKNINKSAKTLSLKLFTHSTFNLPTKTGINSNASIEAGWVLRHGVNDTDNALTVSTCMFGGQHNASQLFTFNGEGLVMNTDNHGYFDELPRCIFRRSDNLVTTRRCNESTKELYQIVPIPSNQSFFLIRSNETNTCLTTDSRHMIVLVNCSLSNLSNVWSFTNPGDVSQTRVINNQTGHCLTVAEPNPQVFGAIAMAFGGIHNGTESLNASNSLLVNGSLQLFPGDNIDLIIAGTILDEFKGITEKDAVSSVLNAAIEYAQDAHKVANLKSKHEEWWQQYWNSSEVDLGSNWTELESFYYGMQYMTGSGAVPTADSVAPGLWGPWITTDKCGWNGDYTTDYNIEMPFQAMASDNRPEFMLSYFTAMETFVPLAEFRANMKKWLGGSPGVPGIFENQFSLWLQVNPNGTANFTGMEWPSHVSRFPGLYHFNDAAIHSIGAFVTANFITYVEYTHDLDFMKNRAFPMALLVAEFYMSYATWDSALGQFNISHSCAQEQCSAQGPDSNMAASGNTPYDIALCKRILRALLKWSTILNYHTDKQQSWKHLLDNLAPYPLTKNSAGETVYAQSQTANGFPDETHTYNARYPIVYFAAIYPGEEIGPESTPAEVNIAASTVLSVNHRNTWSPTNGMCMAWPPATRTIRNATILLSNFTMAIREVMQNNFFPSISNHPDAGSGCPFENAGATIAINEMFVTSHNFTLRFFYNGWPEGQSCSCRSLRTKGAFLVTIPSAVGGKVIGNVTITSIAGNDCVFVAPTFVERDSFSQQAPSVYDETLRNHSVVVPQPVALDGAVKWKLATKPGHTYSLGLF
eukprot:m.345095 g.345095  ORF g.345095 m.345095 type:complete len:1118 (+) comp25741_c0_seq1:555-3908(+)